MGGRHQPEAGADSPAANGSDPPLVELPRVDEDTVRQYVMLHREAGWTEADVRSQIAEVLMADALGRAIHASRGPGYMIDMPKCTRVNKAGEVENVPYGYDDLKGAGYICDCEDIGLFLVAKMKEQQIDEAPQRPTIIVPRDGKAN